MVYILRRKALGKDSTEGLNEYSKHDLPVVLNTNEQPDGHDTCIRWGCTSNIKARKVINSAKAIHRVNDKRAFRKLLQENTVSVPRTYFTHHDIRAYGMFPFIVRPEHHAGGRQLYLCNHPWEILVATRKCGANWYASEYIKKTHEYRIFIMQGKVVCVAQKVPEDVDAVAWNHCQGAVFNNVRWGEWPLQACKIAIEAHNLSKLDFSGVDIMLDKDKPFVLELNSAPSLTSPYRRQCMAKGFDWMLEHGTDTIKPNRNQDWRGVIHPSQWQPKGDRI
jgi:glutathione synthase/RimK-type ligase-like ATP-grasp enzyme